jgi:HD-GYP domain-containing protein (c-di-GMP phosphodiesterase class II)
MPAGTSPDRQAGRLARATSGEHTATMAAGPSPDRDGVRIAELVATLSYAADLGLGQPMDHCLRQTVIALRLADLAGADHADREATYYLGMLVNSYCHADAAEQARWYGDDISFKGDGFEMAVMSTPQGAAMMLRKLTSHGSATARARRLATLPLLGREFETWLLTHTTLGSQFAERIGLGDDVAGALWQAYEQWDGKGPRQLAGEQISVASRLLAIAAVAEVIARRHGVESAKKVTRRHAGTRLDPRLANLFVTRADEVLDGLDSAATWEAVVAAEPRLARRVSGAELDDVLEAMADLIDMKSPYLAGHSRGVANLAAEAGRVAGHSDADRTAVRRAGLLHDLGRLGVSNAVWDKPGPLTDVERERAHLHPFLTDKMLARIPALAASREIAARHHERMDGSGYPRGLGAASLGPLDRLLAAADVYHAMTEPRPHRDALGDTAAAKELRAEVRAGRLDGDAVNAVLRAAGHRAPARREGPAGLTHREVEVLALLARGLANKEIARRLGVTPKTVSNHVEHIYTKIDVGSRAAATLYATQHGLVGSFAPAD